MDKAVVMFSGGQDSTTVLALAVELHGAKNVLAITADYGQRHNTEIDAALTIAKRLGVRHQVAPMQGILEGTSPLTNRNEELETYTSAEEMERIIGDRREKTFVPMRNPLFFCVAYNRAVVFDAGVVYTGICQADNANYSDCRDVFREQFERMANMALGADDRPEVRGIWLTAPLMDLSKAESVKLALQVPRAYECLAFSHTAYSGEFPPITQDHATVLRAQGFREAGVPDPLILRAKNVVRSFVLPDEDHYNRYAPLMANIPFEEGLEVVRGAVIKDMGL